MGMGRPVDDAQPRSHTSRAKEGIFNDRWWSRRRYEGSLTKGLTSRPRGYLGLQEGACAFLALLLHALEIQSLRMQPHPPQFFVQWPYYVLGFGILLFIVAGVICLFQEARHRCHLLRISQSIRETEESPHLEILESFGGGLSSMQKEMLLKEETVI